MLKNMVAMRGQFLTHYANPFADGKDTHRHCQDGLILIKDGKIESIGSYESLVHTIPKGLEIETYDRERYLIMPGFLDTHVHYPQIPMVGAYGKHLIDWLNKYTFVFEQKLSDHNFSTLIAQHFLRESIRNGVTTSFVYATVYLNSVDALFTEAAKLNMRLGTGKVLMDRNAPEPLLDTPESGYHESEELLLKWHNQGRLMYVITPRFAPTSSPEQLKAAGELWRKYPEVYMQTHLSETMAEIEWVQSLYPNHTGYLDVYDKHGLTGKRAIFGHCVHLTENEFHVLRETGSAISHCPTSNLFLGSGLFDIRKAYTENPIRVGLGSDLGAGTAFSPLYTLNEAYKIALLNGCSLLDAYGALYLATRGSAESVYLEDKVGSLEPKMEADFIVLDLESTPFLKFRMKHAKDLKEALFAQIICGDDRAIHATYVNGECVYRRTEKDPNGVFLNQASFLNTPGLTL